MPRAPTPPAALGDVPDARDETAVEEVVRRSFGLRADARRALYRETADAATDTDTPFWLVLMLSGAIALFGLALDATSVVIGAMLVAPMMGPILGLSLALAVGDGRLAVQSAAAILLGALGVVALSAVLTLALPFQEITAEIAARTRPTTLDLAIAIASGLAGAVVMVSRETRLSASIPGVAIAVALIPPLAVAGFGIGSGWNAPVIRGSLLLFGANLGGIVLSGLGVFLLAGMHRSDVIAEARRWHRDGDQRGLAATIERAMGAERLRVVASPWVRGVLVLGFVAAVAFPLTSSLRQVVREVRIRSAADRATGAVEASGAFVLGRSVDIGESSTDVRLRVATASWIDEATRADAEAQARAVAGEVIVVSFDQVILSTGEVGALRASDGAAAETPVPASPASAPPDLSPAALLGRLDGQIGAALATLVLPDSVALLGAQTSLGAGGVRLRVAYAAPARLPRSAETMLAGQAARALGLPPTAATTDAFAPLAFAATDSAGVRALARRLAPFPRARLTVEADSAAAVRTRAALVRAGVPPSALRVRVVPGPPRGATVRFTAAAAAADTTGSR